MPTKDDLRYFQAMPLDVKKMMSKVRLREWAMWFGEENVYISFSGGKDSTVLADLYAQLCKELGWEMWLAFVNTGLEYPEIQRFVKWFAGYLQDKYGIVVHLEILRPAMRFDEVIRKYGYPIIGKESAECVGQARLSLERNDGKYSYRLKKLKGVATDKNGAISKYNIPKYEPLLYTDFRIGAGCCAVMKKRPAKQYEKATGKKAIIATMATESRAREGAWYRTGCNSFDCSRPMSRPLSFWTEQDVLQYIKQNDLPIASVYGNIEYATDPDQLRVWDCGVDDCGGEPLATTGCSRTGCIFCAFGCHLEKEPSRFQRLKQTHPRQYDYCIGGGEYDEDGIWKPNSKGLGMGHVFDELNKIYGDGFIKYK